MSMQRIADLIETNQMIDVNLMSERLSEILGELCSLISEQAREIQELKTELADRCRPSDLHEVENSFNKNLLEIRENIERVQGDIVLSREESKKVVSETKESLLEHMTVVKEEMEATIVGKVHDMQAGELIFSKQIGDTGQQINELKAKNVKFMKALNAIKKTIEANQVDNVEVLQTQVTKLERTVDELIEKERSDTDKLKKEVDTLKQTSEKSYEEICDEIHYMKAETKEMRGLILEVPEFDSCGAIDTETLVRAIQRDSRRIDAFNEVIAALRSDHIVLFDFFVVMTKVFQDFNLNVVDFTRQDSRRNVVVDDMFGDVTRDTERLNAELDDIAQNVIAITEATSEAHGLASSGFQQLLGFLAKLTTKQPPPMLQLFDGALLEFERLKDMLVTQVDTTRRTRRKINDARKGTDKVKEIPVSVIEISVPKMNKSLVIRKRLAGSMAGAGQKVESGPEQSDDGEIVSTDLSMRSALQDFQTELANIAERVESITHSFNAKLELKAESVSVESSIERLRTGVNRLRTEQSKVVRELTDCVRRSDTGMMIRPGDRSAPPEGGVNNPWRSIPRIFEPDNLRGGAHNVIYGEEREQRPQRAQTRLVKVRR